MCMRPCNISIWTTCGWYRGGRFLTKCEEGEIFQWESGSPVSLKKGTVVWTNPHSPRVRTCLVSWHPLNRYLIMKTEIRGSFYKYYKLYETKLCATVFLVEGEDFGCRFASCKKIWTWLLGTIERVSQSDGGAGSRGLDLCSNSAHNREPSSLWKAQVTHQYENACYE